MVGTNLSAGELTLPIKRTEGETLEDRMTDNAYHNILPARYLRKDADGNLVEEQEDLFARVAENIALAEVVYEAEKREEAVTVTPRQLKPDHPRRDELAAEVFGAGTTTGDDAETTLSIYNVNKFSYDTVVPELPAAVREHVEDVRSEFQNLMGKLSFIPNSPTLMNAGDELQQLSACFVDSPEDDLTDIHQTAKESAEVFQSGGGMGYAFWRLRPFGDPVGSTGGIASGPITFMRTFDQMCETIAQGGTRRGAQMGVMRVSHPDVVEFIHAKNKDVSLAHTLKLNDPDDYTYTTFSEALEEARQLIDNEGRVPEHLRNAVEGHLSNFNISVGVTDGFMAALYADDEFTFTNPRTGEPHVATEETEEMYSRYGLGEYVDPGEVLSIPAREIWDRIIEGAHENGEPGVIYLERVNKEHSFDVEEHPEHRILATNPCLAGDMEVRLADESTRTIEDLATADRSVSVRTLEGGDIVTRPATAFKTKSDADIVRVTTESGASIRLTPDHEIRTEGGEWVEANNLSAGDQVVSLSRPLATPRGTEHETTTETIVSVASDGCEDVYDLSVEKTHNFFASDAGGASINVHNCGEQPLEEYEACNLGHINLSTVADREAPDWRVWYDDHRDEYGSIEEAVDAFLAEAIDFEEFDRRIELGTRFLENVVTMSDFPVPEIEEKVREMRKIGLGIMGLAQLYIQFGIRYGSEEGNEVARQLMTHINHGSKWASHEFAEERGSFDEWENSKYATPTDYPEWFEHQTGLDPDEWADGFPIRNHNTTTIAPTGTTSMVGNTTGGCEPIYNVAYYKNVSDDVQGDEMLVEFDDYFLRVLEDNDIDVDAVKREAQEQMATNRFDGVEGLSTVPDPIGELFVITDDLSGKEHAAVQCACQEGVDSAISKCIEEGTLVQTDQGLVPIEEFSDNDEPGTFSDVDGEYTIDGYEVTAHYYAGKKDSTRIRLDSGAELVGATESHQVLTPDGWELLSNLEEGDVVLGDFSVSHSDGGLRIDWTGDLETSSNDIEIPERMSPEFAEFLGMIAADGRAYEETGRVEITTDNMPVEDRYAELCNQLFDAQVKVDADDRTENVRRVFVTSRNLVRCVRSIIGHGAYDKHVPEQVIRGSAEEKLAFVRGLTLDGYNNSNGFTVYGGMSEELAYETAQLLRSFGVPKVYEGRKWVPESEAYEHLVTVSNELQDLVSAIEHHKNPEPMFVRYKVPVDTTQLSLEEYERGTSTYYAVRSARSRGNQYLFDKTAEKIGVDYSGIAYEVTEVEDVDERELYDIEVEESHRYLVNGIISHNTCNFPNDATVEDMNDVYRYIYDNGGKGVTVYRDGTRSKQVLTTRADNAEFSDVDEDEAAEVILERLNEIFGGLEGFLDSDELEAALGRDVDDVLDLDREFELGSKQPRPDVLHGVTQRIDTGYGKLYVNINEDPETGRPFELFANIGNSGGFTASFTEALAKTISTALRSGVDPEEIADELQGIRSPKVAWDKGEQINSIPDAIGTAMRRYLDGEVDKAYPQQQNLSEIAEGADEEGGDERLGGSETAAEETGGGGSAAPTVDSTAAPTAGGTVETSGADTGAEGLSRGDADTDATQSLIDSGESPECPDCGNMTLHYSEGCKTCKSCGWSEC